MTARSEEAQAQLRGLVQVSSLYNGGRASRAQVQQHINAANAWVARASDASGGELAMVREGINTALRALRAGGGTASTARSGESAASQKEREARAVVTASGSGSSKTPTSTGGGSTRTPASREPEDEAPGGLPDLTARPVGLFTAIARTFTGQGDLSTLWVPPGSSFFERPLTQLVLLVGGAATVATVVTVLVARSESKKAEE